MKVSRREWAVRAAMIAWLGFWTWFSIAEIISGEPGALMHLALPLAPMFVICGAAWLRPATGGVLLVLGGIAAGIYFATSGAMLLLAAPALVMGVLLILIEKTNGSAQA